MYCCQHDFQRGFRRRFWSLDFPDPYQVDKALLIQQPINNHDKNMDDNIIPSVRWQDLYRITKYWSSGQCKASILNRINDNHHHQPIDNLSSLTTSKPCLVIGSTHEYSYLTNFTITASGHIIRSNPMYKGPNGRQCLKIHHVMDIKNQHQNKLTFQYLEDHLSHGIVCHYSDSKSNWIVTGGLNGTVSLWDESTLCLKRTWEGHRGRVLCVSMNDKVIISGGSDSMIRVWDLDDVGQRGSIDISSYLSDRLDWFQGVGEIALNGHLIVCAPDASGPILIFSLLTGSLVYELKAEPQDVACTRLCLTPYYLLTKGEINKKNEREVPIYPPSSTFDTSESLSSESSSKSSPSETLSLPMHQTISLSSFTHPSTTSSLTPYQLAKHYSSSLTTTNNNNSNNESSSSSNDLYKQNKFTKSCIDVWDLQTGKLVYRLIPPITNPSVIASIVDIRISPHAAHVFACIEIRNYGQRRHVLCCWDFSNQKFKLPTVVTLPTSISNIHTNNTWACFY
ncbi:unnamed protein product [Cunninghamella blakesleeana]